MSAPLTPEQLAALVEPAGISVDLVDPDTVVLRIGDTEMVFKPTPPRRGSSSLKYQLDVANRLAAASARLYWLLSDPEHRRPDPDAAPWSARSRATREGLRGGT